MTARTPSRTRLVLAFAAVYLVWGSTYLAIRWGVASLPPFLLAGGRSLLAGLVLVAARRVRGDALPSGRQWIHATAVGGLMLLGGNGLVCWAETRVPSGIAALIVACVPLFMVIMSGRRPTLRIVAGILLGLGGIALLVGPQRSTSAVDPWGAGALVVASLSWAAGSLLSRRANLPASGLMAAGAEMFGGGVLLVAASVASRETARFDPAAVTTASWLALAYLVVLGSLVGFTAYMWLLKNTTPARAATYAYVNPVVAVFLGWALGGEPIGARVIVAAAVIVAAVAIIVGAPSPPRGADERA